MGLKGKITIEKEIKCHGDIFYDLFTNKLHDLSNITPDHIQDCDLLEGEYGALGSVNSWKYTYEEKEKCLKTIIETKVEDKKLVRFKGVDGDIFEFYKEYLFSIHVDTNGDDHFAIVTLEYEKLSEDAPEPVSLVAFACNVTKGIEAYHTQ